MLLRQKLTEEVDEFLSSQDPEELADILEVLYALADCLGPGYLSTGQLGVQRLQEGTSLRVVVVTAGQ